MQPPFERRKEPPGIAHWSQGHSRGEEWPQAWNGRVEGTMRSHRQGDKSQAEEKHPRVTRNARDQTNRRHGRKVKRETTHSTSSCQEPQGTCEAYTCCTNMPWTQIEKLVEQKHTLATRTCPRFGCSPSKVPQTPHHTDDNVNGRVSSKQSAHYAIDVAGCVGPLLLAAAQHPAVRSPVS